MKAYILILSSPRLVIPEIKIIEFVKELILSNVLNVECFGGEAEKQCSYFDHELAQQNDSSTFITFRFEDGDIDCINYNEDRIFQFIFDKLESGKIGQVIADDKDIQINIDK